MATEFTGKRVLVTGGANGIGKAIVQKFYEAGATVFALDSNADALKQLKLEFPNVVPIAVDLLDWEASRKAVQAVLPLHHLVNNAGVYKFGGVLDTTVETVDLTFGVNFKAALNLTQVFAKGVIEHKLVGGTIVNISSIGDYMYNGSVAYGSSKAALTMFTRATAIELAEHNIRANTIRPTAIDTDMLRSSTDRPGAREGLAAFLERTPLCKKPLQPSHVANLAYFLSSEQSASITGEDVAIDGGVGIV